MGRATARLKERIGQWVVQEMAIRATMLNFDPMEFEDYASRWASQSNALEPEHPLLEPTRRSVDQQANRGAQSDPGATINPGRLSGNSGVAPFLKVTATVWPWLSSCSPVRSLWMICSR